MGYYFADVIYSSRETCVKTIPVPQENKRQLIANKQEETKKDIECTFGMLQAQFAIMCKPARFFFCIETLKGIMMACII